MVISLILLLLVSCGVAQTPAPADVHVKLTFAENKTVYRIGEPIKLLMDFTADREGYIVEFGPDGYALGSDTVVISPDSGITRWIDEMLDNRFYPRHVFSPDKLDSVPRRVEIAINDKVRFDRPGRYTVFVTTRRVSQRSNSSGRDEPLLLTTNSLSFEIQQMSEADEEKEVKRLTELLNTKRGHQSDEELSKQLSFLTGDPSAREKVRRLLNHEKRGGNYHSNISSGLFIARNRSLVLKLIETALRDPSIPVTDHLLYTAARLKKLYLHGIAEKPLIVDIHAGTLEPPEDPRTVEIREAYIVELAADLPKRTGNNQTTTALTILTSLPRDSQTASAGLREARRILVQHFDTLNPVSQGWLLQRYWDDVRDPALIPSLKKMLASSVTWKRAREAALQRLLELAPDEARSYFIAEIRDANSSVDPKILGALEDKSLPEVDASLLEQIRGRTQITDNRSLVYLKFKVALLARFATNSIYQELMEFYQAVGEKLPVETRVGFLAYFAKHNDREAIPLIEKALSELEPGQYPSVLTDLTNLYYSEPIGALLKKILETDDLAPVSHAAYLMGKHGSPGDEKVLEARLKRWQEQWRNRVADADAQHQGQIERALISALINGKSWKLTSERARELQMSCLTKICQQSNFGPSQ